MFSRWREGFGAGSTVRRLLPTITIGGIAAALVLAGIAGFNLFRPVAGAPAKPAAPAPGTFRPTEAQWRGLKVAPVELLAFRSERVTEGNIAINDDLNTPVFSPYSGRVTGLVAKLGDHVEQGAPLFTIEATEFVQSANTLITAVATLKTARSQLAQAEINARRAGELYQQRAVP